MKLLMMIFNQVALFLPLSSRMPLPHGLAMLGALLRCVSLGLWQTLLLHTEVMTPGIGETTEMNLTMMIEKASTTRKVSITREVITLSWTLTLIKSQAKKLSKSPT